MKNAPMFDLCEYFIRYDEGTLTQEEYLKFFAYLIRSKMAWTLPGRFGREAANLIENGIVCYNGNIIEGGIND